MRRSHGLAARCRRALAAYLRGNDPEAALLESYDCGRQALADGRSVLDLAALYHEALLAAGLRPLLGEDARRLMAAGQEMLSQSLVPFEVVRRGFADANIALRGLNQDLERRVAERTQQLEAALQAAEEASRHKSAFLSNMSHELRTPLNAIIGFADLLLEEPADGYDPATRGMYLQTIHSSGQHLLGLINDILDLAKIEAGRLELYPEQFQVAASVAQILSTVEPLASRKAIALAADAAEAGELVADEGKVKQILYNLLSNAIKFTPQGGQVVLTARGVPEAVQLTVTDTGIGIAQEDQDRIFEEFQQVDAGPDRRYEGTGLGLALTRRLVDLHGGRIWVESAPGQGSHFHVVLPRSAPAPAVHTPRRMPAAVPAEPDNRPLVLVVDDEPSAVEPLDSLLTAAGCTALRAGGGAEGIALARSERPDLVLLDLMMPNVDGFEVVATLKADPATRDIPIVVLTAKSLTEEDKRVLNGQVVAVLQKRTPAGVDLVTWLDDLVRHLWMGAYAT